MAEAGTDAPEPALNDIERIPSMTFWEKVDFFYFPISWVLVAAPVFLIAAFLLAGFSVVFLLHPHLFKQEQGATSLLWLAAVCAVFGAILVYPVRFFRKMRTRKRGSGSSLPSGEELVAFRYRRWHPPVWLRICVALSFSLPAFGITYKMIATPGHRVPAAWGVTVLLWLIAIAVTVDAVWPRRDRQWTGFVASGAFGALAVAGAVAIIRDGGHKPLDFFLPLLFTLLSSLLAVGAVRDGRKSARRRRGGC